MNEAIKNLVVLMWTVSAINSGAESQVVTEYSIEDNNHQALVSTDVSTLALTKQDIEKKLKHSFDKI